MAKESPFNFKLLAGVLLLLLIAYLFYWFQFRPVNIRTMCGKQVSESMASTKGLGTVANYQGMYDLLYKSCLHKKGL